MIKFINIFYISPMEENLFVKIVLKLMKNINIGKKIINICVFCDVKNVIIIFVFRPRECPKKLKKSTMSFENEKQGIEEDTDEDTEQQMNIEKMEKMEDDVCKIIKGIMKCVNIEFKNILNSYSRILKKVKKRTNIIYIKL